MSNWRAGRIVGRREGRVVIEVEPHETLVDPPKGSNVLVLVHEARNIDHHRYYWGILSSVVNASDKWANKEQLHEWIKIRLGLYATGMNADGNVTLKFKSTNFAQMGESEFKDFVDRACNVMAEALGCDPGELLP